jgi:hypothetical protein
MARIRPQEEGQESVRVFLSYVERYLVRDAAEVNSVLRQTPKTLHYRATGEIDKAGADRDLEPRSQEQGERRKDGTKLFLVWCLTISEEERTRYLKTLGAGEVPDGRTTQQ